MNDKMLLQILRDRLLSDDNKVTGLFLTSPHCYFSKEFTKDCVDILAKRLFACTALGDKMNALERLAIYVLMSSAGMPLGLDENGVPK